MVRYGMVIDLRTCIGCFSCITACSQENTRALGAEVKLGARTDITPLEVGKQPSTALIFYHKICRHCDDPPCVHVCPTGASYRTEEGVVLIDYDLCIGCKYCIVACPFNARYVHEGLGAPDKCTFCYHRVKQGLEPACVEACPTFSRIFGDLDDPESEVSKLAVSGIPVGSWHNTEPMVFYIPHARRSGGD